MSRRSGSALFLLELVVTIILFALCASVCLTAFFQANAISREATQVNHAVVATQNLAEFYKAGEVENGIAHSKLESGYLVFYDENWEPGALESDASYIASITLVGGRADIVITRADGTQLFDCSVEKRLEGAAS